MNSKQISRLAVAALLSSFVALQAFADCPQIEGKYTYQCTVKKEDGAVFGEFIDTSGEMLVQQRGCDSYQFENLADGMVETISLVSGDDESNDTYVKVKSATEKSLRFKTITYGRTIIDALTLTSGVFKGSIKKTGRGFTLKGSEKSRVYRFFVHTDSKFSCRFNRD